MENYRKIYTALFIIILISLPYKHTNVINSVAIILTGLVWILEGKWKEKWDNTRSRPIIFLYVLLFILYGVGLLYTVNIKKGFDNFQRIIPLMAFPLIIGSSSIEISKKQIEIIFWSLTGTIFLGTFLCLSRGLYWYFFNSSTEFLYHDNFTKLLDISAIYLSVQIGFCIFWMSNCLIENYFNKSKFLKYLSAFLILYFFIILLFLNIRTAITSILIIYLTGIILFYIKKGKLLYGLLISAGIMIAFLSLIYFNPVSREKFYEAINLKDNIKLSDKEDHSLGRGWGGRATRMAIWQCSIDLIKEYPAFGVGTGDVQDSLQATYRRNKFFFASEYNGYNAHNQYLDTQLAIGIPGLVTLLATFVLPFVLCFRKKDYFYLSFILFVMANCLTESYLVRQKGAVFFALINALLLFQYKKYNLSSTNDHQASPANS